MYMLLRIWCLLEACCYEGTRSSPPSELAALQCYWRSIVFLERQITYIKHCIKITIYCKPLQHVRLINTSGPVQHNDASPMSFEEAATLRPGVYHDPTFEGAEGIVTLLVAISRKYSRRRRASAMVGRSCWW